MPRILVVDDDRAVQEMLVDLLSEAGYDVGTARDGRAVLEELNAQAYDGLLLDVLIPKMNGFALIEQLRQNPTLRELPVIMMSGIYRSRNHRNEMTTRYQVVEYLDKPLVPEQILDLLAKTVGPGGPPKPKPQAASGESTVAARDDSHKSKITKAPQPPAEPPPPPAEEAKLVDQAAQEERQHVEQAAKSDFATSAFLLQGSINNRPVPAVLGRLWHERATGALLLRHDRIKKIVYLKAGNPTFVKSNLVSECLGQVLVRERLISERDCAESIELMKHSGRKQGEILVEMRCITQKNLEFALELQFETKLFETFLWEDGEFRFNASADLPPISTGNHRGAIVVTDGIRRTFDETRLRSLMLPIYDVPLAMPDHEIIDWDEIGLPARELGAVQQMELPLTTRELLEQLPLDPAESLRLVYSLIALELLAPSRSAG